MKILVVGIDGGDENIINGMQMPFMQSLIRNSGKFEIEEDLFARGWAKILSGSSGFATGALYNKPVPLQPGCGSTPSFKASDYKNGQHVPLWEALNERGLTVGFMNIPTTSPAPEVNGFFVSGAGGGVNGDEAPIEACHPKEVKEIIDQTGYIFDTRYTVSGIRDIGLFVDRLKKMSRLRVGAFNTLSKKYNPDVGFLAFMGLARIQYLAMSEIESIIQKKGSNVPLSEHQELISDLYSDFDDQIKNLISENKPENIIFVSDHGQSPFRYEVDIGHFLRSGSWQHDKANSISRTQKSLRSIIKKITPKKFIAKISVNKSIKKFSGAQSVINFSRTTAFSLRQVPGIYINDERFSGPVDQTRKDEIVESIIKSFNSDPEVLRHGFAAEKFDQRWGFSISENPWLPDIWINKPDGYLINYGVGTSEKGLDSTISRNDRYRPNIDYREVSSDQWTGIKGKHALLCIVSDSLSGLSSGEGDLTDAYQFILRIADKYSCGI